MPYEVSLTSNRPGFLTWEKDTRPIGKKDGPIILWNPGQPEFGPVWHVRVNFQDLTPPQRCTEDGKCVYCRATREWNAKRKQVCRVCKESKPLASFAVDDGSHVAVKKGRVTLTCLRCVRLAKVKTMRQARVQAESPTKRCTACKEERPKAEFGKRAASPDGLQYKCRACMGAAIKNAPSRLDR